MIWDIVVEMFVDAKEMNEVSRDVGGSSPLPLHCQNSVLRLPFFLSRLFVLEYQMSGLELQDATVYQQALDLSFKSFHWDWHM